MNGLNDRQKTAVSHFRGPCLVLAGPGSGKTTVVVHRIQHLIEQFGVSPGNILVITFTKAAAKEMEERFYQLIGTRRYKVSFGTFHSLFFRIIRQEYGYSLDNVIKEEEKWEFLKNTVHEMGLEINDEEEYTKDFAAELGRMKNELVSLADYEPSNMQKEEFRILFQKYDAYKARCSKIDFDDMLTECYEILKNNPQTLAQWRGKYPFILVDEFQDINAAQYACVKMLAGPDNNLFVVGDDDQSIYKFRGARPEFLLQFPKDFPNTEKIILNINYRSTEPIIKLSNRLVQHNKKRFEKEHGGTGKDGIITEFFMSEDASLEATRIAKKIKKLHDAGTEYGKIAVIFRTNMQAGHFARAFMDSGIRFNLKDTLFNIYDHWIGKDLAAYLDLAWDNGNNGAFLRIANKPKRYLSRDLLDILKKTEGPMLHTIFTLPSLQGWQSRQIQQLLEHLAQIKRRSAYEAVKYVRNVVAYDDYLEEYAKFRRQSVLGMREIADELLDSAKEIEDGRNFSEHLRRLSEEVKESKKTAQKPLEDAVTLSTIHSAKGLEFDAVFIPSIIEGILPHEKSTSKDEIEEERRLFYVGMTRAKNYLCLSEIKTRYEKPTKRSRFLKELGLGERKKK